MCSSKKALFHLRRFVRHQEITVSNLSVLQLRSEPVSPRGKGRNSAWSIVYFLLDRCEQSGKLRKGVFWIQQPPLQFLGSFGSVQNSKCAQRACEFVGVVSRSL